MTPSNNRKKGSRSYANGLKYYEKLMVAKASSDLREERGSEEQRSHVGGMQCCCLSTRSWCHMKAIALAVAVMIQIGGHDEVIFGVMFAVKFCCLYALSSVALGIADGARKMEFDK